MDNNENFVEQTENVEQTTEETVVEPAKVFTQEDMNAAVGKAKARERAKIEKQYKQKYERLEGVLMAGTGKGSIEEVTDTLEQFYSSKGVKMPQKPYYSAKDIEVLARAEADEIIRGGFEDVVEETDRLAGIGVANMTDREKAVFKVLAEHRQNAERGRELGKLGVTEDVYSSKEFKDFAGKFNPDTPIKDIYDIYAKTQPKKEVKSMGSMKSSTTQDNGLKDYYSYEEAVKFTKKDFDNNPELYKRVQQSMQKWYKK